MSEPKTKKNDASVEKFLNAVEPDRKREDSFTILEMMKEITGEEPSMWGENMIGFGSYHYTYASGREGDWFVTGFSPRKQSLTLYLMYGFEKFGDLLEKLGRHKIGKACLYINKLEDVDQKVLKQLIKKSVTELGRYGT